MDNSKKERMVEIYEELCAINDSFEYEGYIGNRVYDTMSNILDDLSEIISNEEVAEKCLTHEEKNNE